MKSLKTNSLFRFLASLKLAVLSLLSLSAVLALATVLEAKYGMRGAHLLVYGTYWFYGLLLMLGMNVLCAALSRYPWKKTQTGFVITHAGIITVLIGSWVTARFGVDGSLPVIEGAQDRTVILSDLKFTVSDPNSSMEQHYPVPESGRRRSDLALAIALPGDEQIIVEEFLPRVTPHSQWEASPVEGLGAPAIRVEIANSRFSLDEWLVARHPKVANERDLGPAVIRFQQLWTAREATEFLKVKARPKAKRSDLGLLIVEYNGQKFRAPLLAEKKEWTRVATTPFEFKLERYLPYAVVEGENLISKSNEPRNPAVQILVRDPLGAVEKHTLFALFPEFATRHRDVSGKDAQPLAIQLQYEGADAAASGPQAIGRGGKQGELEFGYHPGGELLYRIFNSKGETTGSGIAPVGKEMPTGWMDLQFKVSQFFPHAVERSAPIYVDEIGGGPANFLSAIRFRRERKGQVVQPSAYLVEGDAKEFLVDGQTLSFGFDKERLTLPFEIYLEKFHVGNDPGTQKPGSYESRVKVYDGRELASNATLISMNEPLKHGGYTFYQASYQLREGKPPISVFSVNYDPGRMIKYAGCLIMVLGIILMFYLNPHYWDKVLGGTRRRA